ncbi:hypothetical protein SAMN02949497_1342 [Methylomagnum ishizawai]|uniref:Uncharacterized protein n=1 Tax=Methylomagnum ishizawai TaxID=1760988 RepID=A0A1Y6CV05_9GAMM|nr:hypothetical protein [Methylomagnum ishizawai]SMF94040.1 hypothetical protein SAMN02949497_1342 [Methylomagnum ishizawai]
MSNPNPAFLVDGITTIAIHNDVARIQFMQLDQQGKPMDTVRLLIPTSQAQQIHQAIGQLAGLNPNPSAQPDKAEETPTKKDERPGSRLAQKQDAPKPWKP